jgi:hypothetical protein
VVSCEGNKTAEENRLCFVSICSEGWLLFLFKNKIGTYISFQVVSVMRKRQAAHKTVWSNVAGGEFDA